MMSRWISEVPPAMLAARLHSHWRAHGPADRPDRSPAPATDKPASDRCWVMAVQASFTQLDSGPGSSPRSRRDRVRKLCSRSTPKRDPGLGQGVGQLRVVERPADRAASS